MEGRDQGKAEGREGGVEVGQRFQMLSWKEDLWLQMYTAGFWFVDFQPDSWFDFDTGGGEG